MPVDQPQQPSTQHTNTRTQPGTPQNTGNNTTNTVELSLASLEAPRAQGENFGANETSDILRSRLAEDPWHSSELQLGEAFFGSDISVSTDPTEPESLTDSSTDLFGSDSDSDGSQDPYVWLVTEQFDLDIKWTEPGVKKCLKRKAIPLTSCVYKALKPSILHCGKYFYLGDRGN